MSMPCRLQRDHPGRIFLHGLHRVGAPVDTKVNVTVDHSRQEAPPIEIDRLMTVLFGRTGSLPHFYNSIPFYHDKAACLDFPAAVDYLRISQDNPHPSS